MGFQPTIASYLQRVPRDWDLDLLVVYEPAPAPPSLADFLALPDALARLGWSSATSIKPWRISRSKLVPRIGHQSTPDTNFPPCCPNRRHRMSIVIKRSRGRCDSH